MCFSVSDSTSIIFLLCYADATLDIIDITDSPTPVEESKANKKSPTPTRQKALTSMFSEKYARGSTQAKKLTEAVTYFLCKDGQPAYTVDCQGFKHMVSVLDPRLVLHVIWSCLKNGTTS